MKKRHASHLFHFQCDECIKGLRPALFYIFLIINKSLEKVKTNNVSVMLSPHRFCGIYPQSRLVLTAEITLCKNLLNMQFPSLNSLSVFNNHQLIQTDLNKVRRISVHSFILKFYFEIMGLFLLPSLSAVVCGADVTDDVYFNTTATRSMQLNNSILSQHFMLLNCLTDVRCVYLYLVPL